MKRYCLALDLKNDAALIAEYEQYHRDVWAGIKKSITDSGITNMEIYRFDNHLFMVLETEDTFTFERKTAMDNTNPEVQRWESLMWKFQQPLKNAKPGEKWVLMDRIFKLKE